MGYLEAIDRQIAAKHLLTHPFYQAWTRGDLSREALQDYAYSTKSPADRSPHAQN
jgi:Pyrroloquinoline quinone (Coenzyme PQQ) biosynthesis protein C